jgi:hypothetical protein
MQVRTGVDSDSLKRGFCPKQQEEEKEFYFKATY